MGRSVRCRHILVAGVLAALAFVAPATGAPPTQFVDDDTDVATLEVGARDLFVVSLGDSVAAGEGNPDQGRWRSQRCHRSRAAGVEQAIRLLAQANPDRGITFVNLACSGATVDAGVLGPYRGIEHPAGAAPVPAQVDRLEALVARAGRPADAVLLSVGANDVHFGDIVVHCIATPACPSSGFDPDHLGRGTTADIAVGGALDRLAARYDALGARLGPRVVVPGRVLITEYFDPTRGRDGQPCASIAAGISRDELRWAEDSVLSPLNHAVAAAGLRNGWHTVTGIASDFATHGYCTSRAERWVRRISESLANRAGPLHPNASGHLAIAARIAPALAKELKLIPGAQTASGSAADKDGGAPWWVFLVGAVILVIGGVLLAGPIWRWGRRVTLLFRRGRLHEHADVASPELERLAPSADDGAKALLDLLIKAAGTLGTAVFSLGFVVLVGAAIVWVRFWAARYPADQAS